MADTLKEKTTRGLFWGALNSGTTQVLNLLIGIILGRLLSPGEYGTIGYIAIFTAIAGNLQSSGFSTYLINMKDPKHEDYNAVFWFNILMSFTLYTILWFAAPLIADFFHQPELIRLSHFVFLSFVVGSFGITPNAYLTRKLMVKEMTVINSLALILSGLTGVTLAFLGYSYWSLAWQQVLYITILNIGRYHYVAWRPSWHIDLRPIRKMFGFSMNILVVMVMNTVNNNIMSVIIGKFFNKNILGNYSQAYKWNFMAYSLVANTTQQVAQPVFASIAEERERERRVFRKMMRFTAFLAFPAMLGLVLVAREFILLTIGPKWTDAVPLLQILAVSGAFFPFYTLYQNLVIGQGHADINMWCNVGQIALQVVLMLCTHTLGITVMIAVYSGFNIIWLLAWQTQAHRLIGLRLWEVCKDIAPFLAASATVMAVTGLATQFIESHALLLLARIVLAAVLYFAVMKMARVQILEECLQFAKKKLKK